MADNPTVNGIQVAGDDINGVIHQLVGLEFGAPDSLTRVTGGNPLPTVDAALATAVAAVATAAKQDVAKAVLDAIASALAGTLAIRQSGTFGYGAGTAAATVDVPTQARLQRVSILAGNSSATVTIGGGATITIPAGASFDDAIPGSALGADVVIGGSVVSYYVSWVV